MALKENQYDLASKEIERHIQDASTSKVAHFLIAKKYGKLERRMQWVSAASFAGLVLMWFISTQLFAAVEGFGIHISAPLRSIAQSTIPTFFVAASIIATTFLFINRYGEKSHGHREAAQRYHRFFRKCLNWQTDCPDTSYAAALADKAATYRDELSEINHASPDIEEWAWEHVDDELAKGGTEYAVDQTES